MSNDRSGDIVSLSIFVAAVDQMVQIRKPLKNLASTFDIAVERDDLRLEVVRGVCRKVWCVLVAAMSVSSLISTMHGVSESMVTRMIV